MKLDLLIKEIPDQNIRENFNRLKRELEAQQILDGFWRFFEVEFPSGGNSLPVKHNLSFIPRDIIFLSVEGDYNIYFNYAEFDASNIYVTTQGACRIRFLAGNYKNKSYGGSKKDFSFVAPASGGGGSGTPWFTGAGNPSGALGSAGDFYLNTTTKDVFLKTGVSTWTLQGDLQDTPDSTTTINVLAGTTVTAFSTALTDFLSIDFLMNLRKSDFSQVRTQKMLVHRTASDLSDTVYGRSGSSLACEISTQISGLNAELLVTNNEVFDVLFSFKKTVIN